jgi:hypothetical protein
MVKAEGWGTYPKCKARPSYNLVLGLLFWESRPCCGLIRYVNHFEKFPIEFGEHLISTNIPNRGGIIYYTYSSRARGSLGFRVLVDHLTTNLHVVCFSSMKQGRDLYQSLLTVAEELLCLCIIWRFFYTQKNQRVSGTFSSDLAKFKLNVQFLCKIGIFEAFLILIRIQ